MLSLFTLIKYDVGSYKQEWAHILRGLGNFPLLHSGRERSPTGEMTCSHFAYALFFARYGHERTCNSCSYTLLQNLLCLVDRKTGEKSKTRPRFIKQDQIAIVRLCVSGGVVCMETFKNFPQMGRFTLRDEGKLTVNSLFQWVPVI